MHPYKDIRTIITALSAYVIIVYVIMVTLVTLVTKHFSVYALVRVMGMPHQRFVLPTSCNFLFNRSFQLAVA